MHVKVNHKTGFSKVGLKNMKMKVVCVIRNDPFFISKIVLLNLSAMGENLNRWEGAEHEWDLDMGLSRREIKGLPRNGLNIFTIRIPLSLPSPKVFPKIERFGPKSWWQ